MLVDRTQEDQPNPHDTLVVLRPDGDSQTHLGGRYLRLTATVLGQNTDAGGQYQLALTKISAFYGDKDVALGKPVSADPVNGNPGNVPVSGFSWAANSHNSSTANLTRPARPMGEGIVTDNPKNVIEAAKWRPPKLAARTPVSGVSLGKEGAFHGAMARNIAYLLNNTESSLEALTNDFLSRAGLPLPGNATYPPYFWNDLPGSNAARFLMGAANTLRWIDNDDLRARLESVLDTIAKSAQSDGYIMAFSEDEMFTSEHGAYTRSWVTHGLLEAGYLGYTKAFDLLRGFYDWYNQYPHIEKLLRGASQGGQGQVANTRVARSPIGKPEDAQVVQRYFQENYWLEGLAQQDESMIWQYPYDHSHTYLTTNVEAYADQYLLTGDRRYLGMIKGYWELMRAHWIHIGGSTAIVEFGEYPPGSYRTEADTGELCGNSFWIRLNQRLHWLFPDEEKYVAEIERSIYNVVMANQDGETGILYHANLVQSKDFGQLNLYGENINTCCEGQGTRTLGSLAEFVFSTAEDGLYVNLFDTAAITWELGGRNVTLRMDTEFPFGNDVVLTWDASTSAAANVRIRVPSWATSDMSVLVNNVHVQTGKPGTYVSLQRTWALNDTIKMTLPAAYMLTKYTGLDQSTDGTRYGIEYGPILMAVVGPDQAVLQLPGGPDPEGLTKSLVAIPNQPLHSNITGNDGYALMPYWQVSHEVFTCLPVVKTA